MTPFHTGFTDELTKEAGLLSGVKGLVQRTKPQKMSLGYFKRRRIAKQLGVKPKEVEAELQRLGRSRRRKNLGVAAGGLAMGSAMGSQL